jgi:prepilin-type N-terminal cleavage/methylation domain-containing protein
MIGNVRAREGWRSEGGFSLVEVLVAIALFSVALLGLNAMLVATLRASEFSRDLARARFLAAHRLEQIKNARYMDGNRDAYRNPADVCTDIDEIRGAVFFDEDYGEVDLLNGTQFSYRACAATPDIKRTGVRITRTDYPSGAQGDHDYEVNHAQYDRFRREVYIVDSLAFTDHIRTVSLDGPNPDARDNVIVDTVTPTANQPATNYVKHVLVRVKWRDSNGAPHHVTLSTEKAFYIPAF